MLVVLWALALQFRRQSGWQLVVTRPLNVERHSVPILIGGCPMLPNPLLYTIWEKVCSKGASYKRPPSIQSDNKTLSNVVKIWCTVWYLVWEIDQLQTFECWNGDRSSRCSWYICEDSLGSVWIMYSIKSNESDKDKISLHYLRYFPSSFFNCENSNLHKSRIQTQP